MLNDDVGFLAIFIVLPTVLIVSGFWLILFVRRDAQSRSMSRVNLTSETAEAITSAGTSAAGGSPVTLGAGFDERQDEIGPVVLPGGADPIAVLPSDWALPSELDALTSPPDLEGPQDQLSPVVADLLYSDAPPPVPTVTNARLIELLEEEDRETMREAIAAEDDVELSSEELIGPTEEIASPDDYLEYLGVSLPAANEELEADEVMAEPPSEEPEPQDTEASTGSESAGDTAELPEAWEIEAEILEEQADGADVDADARRQRQPESRLVPSRQHARRRGRSSGRRVPKIPRSTPRDEDAVEGEDRG